ncbi:DUF2989 domain-containing protein [Shewanella abyssi]|uniref:DUF2989 domain-containing protein n=1 Tax=Shewanella abyssi TaxID=311789 RepID=UPI00200EFEC7|nr:DUF2989 domain-containing protein [Shewanella abyssi]MCL1052228.1 DUF2989 domain-containing protein [Shewanella abyssi]
MFTSFLAFTAFFGLFGCDQVSNTAVICNKNPELCLDLHKDSWCRFEKGDLIRSRFKLKQTIEPNGEQLFDQLLYLEDYNKCIELAAGVQHILHPERTNDRARAFGLSSQTLAELQESTKNSIEPHLAYYHWSRFNDTEAGKVLFAAEKSGLISDIRLKAQLAAHYLRIDSLKSKRLYAEALNGSDEDTFDPDWLLALATIYRQEQRLEMHYLLSKTNIIITQSNFAEKQMLAMLQGNRLLQEKLDEEAEDLADVLRSGKYAESKLKIVLEQDLSFAD